MTTAREASDRLASLLRHERIAMADFLLELARFDADKRWRELGHTSLFWYLHKELKLSKAAAQARKAAAELIQTFPEVEAALRSGELCLSTVNDVAKVLTRENVDEVLPRFFGLSHREAEAVAVTIRPVEVVPTREVVTTVAPSRSERTLVASVLDTAHAAATASATDSSQGVVRTSEPLLWGSTPRKQPTTTRTPATAARVPPRSTAEPLTTDDARLHLTVSRRFLDKLEAAKDALAHVFPDGDSAAILERGLDLALAEAAKRKGLVEKPQAEARPSKPDHIPAHVKRAVWQRAGGRCEYVLDSGDRCGETRCLEFDHVKARALGGASTVVNVRLTCRGHNLLAARRTFGDAWMDMYTLRVREPVAWYGGDPAAPPLTPALSPRSQ